MVTLRCAICGNADKQIVLYPQNFSYEKLNQKIFSARRIPDRLHYQIVKCQKCGLIFSNPILDQRKIQDLYEKSGFYYSEESEYLKKTYAYYFKKVIDNRNTENASLLDIGCGNGFFLEEAKKLGIHNLYGIEPGKPSIQKAPKWLKKNITQDILRKKSYKKNTFDFVTCFQTFDHIVNPNEFLQIIHSILKEQGRVLFIQHNTDGLSVKLFKEKSPIFDIEHIYLFNKQTLKSIFEKNGFDIIDEFEVVNTYPLKYWTRMSPMPNAFKKMILSFYTFFKIQNIPLRIPAGNRGIIAQKK